jgi:TPR repeat protein
MYDPVAARIHQDNQEYHRAMWCENQRYHEATLREQAAMRSLMELQARAELARLREEQMVAAQSRTLQKMVEVFQRTMAQGISYLEKGAYPAAIAEFQKAKDNFISREIRAVVSALDDDRSLFSNGDFLKTTRRKWEEISPDYYHNMSLALLLNKQFSSAILCSDDLIEKDPNNYEAYNIRAKAEIRLARREHNEFPACIVRDLDKSLHLSPNQESMVARRYFVQGDFPNAIKFLKRQLERREIPLSERIELLEFLGDAYSATKDMERALEAYEIALKTVPDHLQYFEQIEILRTKRGDILLEAGKEEEAFAEYQKAHEANENNPLCFIPEANRGDAEKQFLLGEAYYKGTSAIKRNWAKAKEWFLKCAEKNDRARFLLGEMHERGGPGLGKNLTEAVRFYRESSDGNGQYNAGMFLLKGGEGLAADPRQALECLRYAADHANPKLRTEASFELGKLLSEGAGVERSFPEACQRYQFVADSAVEGVDAAEKTRAAYTVGVWYLEGRDGIPKNLTALGAFKYLPQLHRAGYAQARDPYARMLFEAAETYSQDRKQEVLGNYTKAANLGHAMAAFRAGELYLLGAPGITKQRELAKKYLQIAADGGVGEAKALLDEMNLTWIKRVILSFSGKDKHR